jgi:hypothetical protein
MTEYSRMAKGRFVSTGMAQVVNLPFLPDYIEMTNYTATLAAPTSQAVVSAMWDSNMGQGFAVEQVYDATPDLVVDAVTSNGFSTFQAGQLLQFGPTLAISGITKAAAAVVTTTTNHNLADGDVVVFQGLYQSATTGMAQIAGVPFTVTVTGATTFSIPWNTNQSNYTALAASPAGATVKKVLYPYLYFPGMAVISAITLGATTTVHTADAHNFVVGQEVAFRIPQQWGTVELNSLPNNLTPGAPAYGYVIAVTDYNTVVVNIDSSAYTAFNSNQTIAAVPGQSFAQIVAVGDVNTGGVAIYSGSPLYPAPQYGPFATTLVSTINGPAIKGAFVNNSAMGFVVGNGAGVNESSSVLVGTAGDVILWRAMLHDLNYSNIP